MTSQPDRIPTRSRLRDVFGRRFDPCRLVERVHPEDLARDAEVVQRGARHFLVIELTPDMLDALAAFGTETDDLEENGDREPVTHDDEDDGAEDRRDLILYRRAAEAD